MVTTGSSAFGLATRIARMATEEMGALVPRKVLAEAAAVLLPQMAFNRTRTAVLRFAGVQLGPHSLILGPIRLIGTGNPCKLVSIGEYTIITGPLYLDLGAEVRIGDGVRIGHDVTLMTVTHEIGTRDLRSGARRVGPIDIGNGAWIASRVTVLPGVAIGSGAVVAAGAVVTRDVPNDTLVAGVPARVVRTLDPEGHPRSSRRGADPHGMDPPLSERRPPFSERLR